MEIAVRSLVSLILFFPCLISAQPVADFQATPQSGCAPFVISFQDLSQGDIVSWEWEVGVSQSSLQNPGVFYQSPGDYDIQLIVTDRQGRKDTLLKPQYVHIYGKPTVQFSAQKVSLCTYEPVQFTDISSPGSGQLTQWTWDFGNGQTSNLSNPTTSYVQPGDYPVSLIVQNQFGCEADLILNQYIQVQAPDPDFSGDQLLACGPPLTVNFTSQTNSGSHFWDMGDGTTSTQVDPQHTYTQNGSFDVQHIVADSKGCRDTLTQAAYINIGVNTLSVFALDSSVCLRDTVYFFTNAASNSTIFWDFGDGTVDSVLNPKHLYQNPGQYNAQVTISDQSGCTNTLSLPIEVFGYPSIDFTVADTNLGCTVPFQVQFQDLTTNGLSWQWNFGDGTQSTLQNPQHLYTSADSFTVSLRVTGPGGCSDSWRKKNYIVVQPLSVGFVAEPRGGCAPRPVQFTDTTNSVYPIVSWDWDFGDGNTGTGRTLFNTYQNPGFYDVQLIVENSAGCKDTVLRPGYTSAGSPPTINFTADTLEACALDEVNFINQTTGATNFIWYFGDGDTAMSANPSHGFAALGDVDVMLVASDRGCKDTLYRPDYVHILAPLPIIGLSDKVLCSAPDTVVFQNLTIGDDYWEWELEDGYKTTDQTFSYPITKEGFFNLSLTVGNVTTGCEVTAEDSIFVLPVVADFVVDTQRACTPALLRFADSSHNAIEWRWDFGNGDTSNLQNPNIWYDTAGSYDVTLVVKNAVKCYDTLQQTAYIQGLASQADFVVLTPTAGCLPLQIDFEDRSTGTGTIVDWFWDFGDGTTSTQQHPSHLYTQAGFFAVSLTVTDTDGCSHTYTVTDAIYATQPVVDFGVNPPVNCPDFNSTFVSLAKGAGLSYWWDFGDGNGSWLANTFHSYADTGYYDVTLTVTDVNGCKDSITKLNRVEVRDLAATFTADTVYASCPPLTVSFLSDTSYNHPNINWFWDFGDGATGAHPFPTHVYTQPGSYDVTFIISSSTGCSDTIVVPDMIVIEGPQAEIQFTPGEGCPGTEFTFNAITTDSVAYQWLFGDGSIDTGLTVLHPYQSPGNYVPVLKVVDTLGCAVFTPADSAIEVFAPPATQFSANLVQFCDSGTVQFTDLSTSDSPIIDWQWDFGDGDSSTQASPSHRYTSPGVYAVQLITLNANGCADTLRQDSFIHIFRSPVPLLSLQPGEEVCAGTALSLQGTAPGHPYPLTDYEWDLSDGLATGTAITHIYTQAGAYPIQLAITDQNGCVGQQTDTVRVHPTPIPLFSQDDSLGCAPFPVNFQNLTSGTIAQLNWDFGDGQQSTDPTPSHLYAQNGVYEVSLTVTDSNGCTATLLKNAAVQLAVPTAAFVLSDTVVCPGTEVFFADQSVSTRPLVSWQWSFGDGNNSSQASPAHTYAQSGFYPVSLTITDSLGCSDTYTDSSAIEILRDQIPKILPIQSVTVTGARSVNIRYEPFPNLYKDFGAYVIYRRDASGDFQEIGRVTDISETIFTDSDARPEEKSECYKVQIVNRCGTSYPLELAQAHCTLSLTATALIEEVALDWTPYIGWTEVEQFNIYRVENYQPNRMELIASIPGNLTAYIDDDLFCYAEYSYRVEAISRSGQSLSDTAFARPVHLTPNEPAHTRRVSVEDNAYVTVSWELPAVENAVAVVVERDAGNGYQEIRREAINLGTSKFNDLAAKFQDQVYDYRVSVVDTCGDYTPVGRHGVNIHLTTRQVGNSVQLNWTPYEGWENGVSEYEIQYYSTADDAYLKLATTPGQVTEYLDETVLNSAGQVCYRIIGFEAEGNQENSISNESCTELSGQIMAATAFSPNNDGHNDVFQLYGVFLESFELVIYNRWGNEVFRTQSLDDHWTGRNLSGYACQEGVYAYVASGVGINGQPVKRVGSITLIR